MKFLTIVIIIFLSINPQKKFHVNGVLKNCNENDQDSRERYLVLKQLDSVVLKNIKTRFGEFELKNLNEGKYTIEYKNIFGQTCSKPFELRREKKIEIELCTDKFIDTNKRTYIDEIENDTLFLEYNSLGCFHSVAKRVLFYKDNSILTAELINEKGEIEKTKFQNHKKAALSLLFREMLEIKNGMQGCTTGESYILKMKGKKEILISDETCDWNGFAKLERLIK